MLALSAVAVAFVSGPSLYGGMAISVFSFQDLSFIMKDQYVGTWFPWFQGHPLISGAMPLESGAGFA